jgi:hypothetical protein
LVLQHAVRLESFGSNTVITCNEAQARSLLLFTAYCPGVIASVHDALRAAGLSHEHASQIETGVKTTMTNVKMVEMPLPDGGSAKKKVGDSAAT